MTISIGTHCEMEIAHRLPLHAGKCRRIHGHTYKLDVEVAGVIGSDGMVLDFGVLKQILRSEIEEKLDHALVLSPLDMDKLALPEGSKMVLFDKEPTAENMLVWIVGILDAALYIPYGVKVSCATLHETSNNWARYLP